MNEHIELLKEFLDIPITGVEAIRKDNGDTTWHFTLEDGVTAQVTAAQLHSQQKFQIRMIEAANVIPLDVRPAWWRDVVQAVLGAAKETKAPVCPAA